MYIEIDLKRGVRRHVNEGLLRRSVRIALEEASLTGNYKVIVPNRRQSISRHGIIFKGIRSNQLHLWVQLKGADGCCECFLTGTSGEMSSEQINEALLKRFPNRYWSDGSSGSNGETRPETPPSASQEDLLANTPEDEVLIGNTETASPNNDTERSENGEEQLSDLKEILRKNSEANVIAREALQKVLVDGKTLRARGVLDLLNTELKISLPPSAVGLLTSAFIRTGVLDVASEGPRLYKLGTGKHERRKNDVVDDAPDIDPSLRHIVALAGQSRLNASRLQEIVEKIAGIDLRVAELATKRVELEAERVAVENSGVKFRETMRQLDELALQAQALMEPSPPATPEVA